ncbi:PREDICTED: spermatid-specific manchette-related protein 1 [Myotis davidii]|uniref:spermatid-specific manchette-related protein 1 n=1 Tax=Myotis davidii TaxID=225400 RepID=UPI0003EC0988|nr:PREDICTED: spermatid-specific manchette-related protein 1 [Myotis davidii]
MFLFSRKTRTPISTYTDSYRAPNSIKKVYNDPPLWAWEPNKFVSRGPPKTFQRPVDQEALEKMVKCAVRDYTYKSSIPGHPYLPEKYWPSQKEADKCNPSYLCSDWGNAWRMGPCCCTGWNKCTTCLPRLPKEAGMETAVRGMPLEYPPKPEPLNAYEREVVVNMLNSLSRVQQLPSREPRPGSVSPSEHRPGMQCAVLTPLRPYYPYANLRWDTSHFKKTGGSQRNSYVVHPEFLSESYPGYSYW